MLKLYEGVRFLTILLSLKHEKFYELSDKMKDRIGVMIIDVGILICSISMDEMKDGFAKETDFVLFHLLEELQFVMEEVAQIYPPSSLQLSFPRTNELGFIDFLLENLKEVKAGSSTFPMAEIKTVQEDLVVIRSFLEKIVDQRNQNEKLQGFWSHVMEVAYKVEFIIESTVLGDEHEHCLGSVAREINLIRIEALEIYDNIRHDGETPRVTQNLIQMPSHVTAPISSEDFVGLKDEMETIINRLTRGSMLLDIVPVVGMAGLGKTTLANTVYCDPSVIIHFPIRVWCTVSQAYIKHNLIAQILSCIASGSSDEYLKMTEDDLAEKLYKCLKRNRYLIILDDMWDIGVWNLLKTSLPDDANQSRILFTSRFQNMSMQIKPDSKPHHLRSLTDKESWELLQIKLFGNVGCPPSLCEVGIQIANNCKGLPLSVVLVAGILATTTQDCAMWEEVAKSLSSSIVLEAEQCMKTLEKGLDRPHEALPSLL
ncbi:putative late blight resistance protein homolog R1B-17 [Coffea arabica]|uniref:Late blight resistance protein homolog R1B-17 n=1 Tax=Coffea arabica TaxID=13443 RepID=A0A6P6TFQ5_COFAR|nr:putative late blight resistance protein homolog R1B-17 [Coffea arabica]